MRIPSALELLALWERGLLLPPLRRGLLLLAQLFPDQEAGALAQLPIGVRDGYLLTLREQLFGRQLASIARCPACDERLEIYLATDDLRPSALDPPGEVTATTAERASFRLRCRPPNSADLLAIAELADPVAARHALLRRCVLSVTDQQSGAEVSLDQLPAPVTDAAVQQMAQADPQGDVQLALTCPHCGHAWSAAFDVLTFLWAEIGAWAHRTLREVHTLAAAYGWPEREILALSAQRRQLYLQLATGL
jgi:hypothetical protein